MIDNDFSPDRTQLRILGQLFLQANNFPWAPSLSEVELIRRVFGKDLEYNRMELLSELIEHGLIRVPPTNLGDKTESSAVCLTAAGTYYYISRAALIAENAHSITDDFPEDIVDAPWALLSYFGPGEDQIAPGADRYVRFDDNAEAYMAAFKALEKVSEALASDNEIGATEPAIRDEKLAELTAIRQLLEKKEGFSSKIIALAWGVLGYLMSHFADRPIGYLAERAWDAIKAVVGLR